METTGLVLVVFFSATLSSSSGGSLYNSASEDLVNKFFDHHRELGGQIAKGRMTRTEPWDAPPPSVYDDYAEDQPSQLLEMAKPAGSKVVERRSDLRLLWPLKAALRKPH